MHRKGGGRKPGKVGPGAGQRPRLCTVTTSSPQEADTEGNRGSEQVSGQGKVCLVRARPAPPPTLCEPWQEEGKGPVPTETARAEACPEPRPLTGRGSPQTQARSVSSSWVLGAAWKTKAGPRPWLSALWPAVAGSSAPLGPLCPLNFGLRAASSNPIRTTVPQTSCFHRKQEDRASTHPTLPQEHGLQTLQGRVHSCGPGGWGPQPRVAPMSQVVVPGWLAGHVKSRRAACPC